MPDDKAVEKPWWKEPAILSALIGSWFSLGAGVLNKVNIINFQIGKSELDNPSVKEAPRKSRQNE